MVITATEKEILNLFNSFVVNGGPYWTRDMIENAMKKGKLQFWGKDVEIVFTD